MEYLSKVDNELSHIEKEINFYSFLNPLNTEKEKNIFFSGIENGETYNPHFNYQKGEFDSYHRKLEHLLKIVKNKTLLEKLFIDKIRYIQEKLNLLKATDRDFSLISKRLFGTVPEEAVERAKDILDMPAENSEEEKISPYEMVEQLKKEIQKYNLAWEVSISSNIIPKVSILPNIETVYVNVNHRYTKGEIERLKVHEMVHVLRGVNGGLQPWEIFKNGLDKYEETEEGVAVWTENETGKLKLDKRQLRIYAGRLLAIYYGLNSSFYETFCNLKKYFSSFMAYRLTERAKRGLKNTKKAGAFTKDCHYLRGWEKVEGFIQGGSIETMYVGKIGLKHVDIVEELLQQGVLKKPKFRLKV